MAWLPKNGRAPDRQSAPTAWQTKVCLFEGCRARGFVIYQFFRVAGFVLLAFRILDSVKKPPKTRKLVSRERIGQGCEEENHVRLARMIDLG